MIKYFELLLDLLDINQKQNFIQIASIIESNKDKNIKIYHQYAFIFEWYQKLVNWVLSPEEFIQLWDIDSSIRFDINKPDSISYLKSNPEIEKDSIYIFDSIANGAIAGADNVFYC